MSSVVIAGDTSGTCTLQAPAVSGSTVLTLPTTSATLITDSSGILNIGSGQVYKDASGNVGIGIALPSEKLMVNAGNIFSNGGCFKTNRSSVSADTTAGLVLQIDGNIHAQITTPSSGSMAMYTAATERMRIDASGNVTLQENISVGGAAPTTVGTGITFPATQAASSNANTLDDYEEGTWTPVLTFATTGTMTYTTSTASGIYTKIGNVVTCRIVFVLTAFTIGTASGQARISLPFISAQNYFSALVYGSNFTTTYPTLALSAAAVSYTTLFGNTAINTTPVGIGAANFSATSNIFFSITYTV